MLLPEGNNVVDAMAILYAVRLRVDGPAFHDLEIEAEWRHGES